MDFVDRVWPGSMPRVLLHRECPLCTSIEFQSAEKGSFDNLLTLFKLSPARCVNCWRRYYLFGKQAL